MGLLALVNLMAVLILIPVAMRVLDDYREQIKPASSNRYSRPNGLTT